MFGFQSMSFLGAKMDTLLGCPFNLEGGFYLLDLVPGFLRGFDERSDQLGCPLRTHNNLLLIAQLDDLLAFCEITVPLAGYFLCFGDFFKHPKAFHQSIGE